MSSARDEFFVGYAETSRPVRALLRAVVVVLAVGLTLAAIVFGAAQRDPGDGIWDSQPQTLEGTYTARPSPTLITRDGPVLLVGEGKRSSPLVGGLGEDVRVRVVGTLLRRGELRVMEAISVEPLAEASAPFAGVNDDGPVALVGEIIDPKCFSAAMKPGDGKAHKACATLCIRGGIPPMFAVRTPGEGVQLYLLTGPDGGALPAEELEAIIPFIADQVSVEGRRMHSGERRLLRIERIRRLTP